jgi:hypothetical protein
MAQPDMTITYPAQWTPMEFVCRCGVKCRVDFEVIFGPYSGQIFRHPCGKDEGRYVPGPIIATWVEQNGTLVATEKRG